MKNQTFEERASCFPLKESRFQRTDLNPHNKERRNFIKPSITFAPKSISSDFQKAKLEDPQFILTQEEMTKQRNATDLLIQRTTQVILKGSDELKDALKKGTIDLHQAALISELPKKEQVHALLIPIKRATSFDEAIHEIMLCIKKEMDALNEELKSLSDARKETNIRSPPFQKIRKKFQQFIAKIRPFT